MMTLVELTEPVRMLMVAEIDHDIESAVLFLSPRLNSRGRAEYPTALRVAALSGTPSSLSVAIERGRMLNSTELSHRNGRVFTKSVPHDAAQSLAEGEFNRFYIRAICRYALDNQQEEVEIYRAKNVASPRSESQRKIGKRITCQSLLADLRQHDHVETALGIPAGPNSGLSVRRVAT